VSSSSRTTGTSRTTPIDRRTSFTLAGVFGLRMLGMFTILPVFALYEEALPGGHDHRLVDMALGARGLTQALLQIPLGLAVRSMGTQTHDPRLRQFRAARGPEGPLRGDPRLAAFGRSRISRNAPLQAKGNASGVYASLQFLGAPAGCSRACVHCRAYRTRGSMWTGPDSMRTMR